MGLKVVSPPIATGPVSLAEAKLHLRVTHTTEDGHIEDLLAAATEWCEERSGMSFMTRTYELQLAEFPANGIIELPMGPVVSTQVEYYDEDRTNQNLAVGWYDDLYSRPPRIYLREGYAWPTTGTFHDAVRIVYDAGVADPALVPARAKQAIKLLVGHWYANREEFVTGTISSRIETAAEALLDSLWSGQLP